MKTYYVYLLASRRNGTLYCGVTNNLIRRIWEHRNHKIPGFTARYNVALLVWYEEHGDIHEAISRETRIKGWRRAWKLQLIEKTNPQWLDLYDSLLPGPVIDRTRARGETIPINPPNDCSGVIPETPKALSGTQGRHLDPWSPGSGSSALSRLRPE